jgi:ferredoxin-NADP reductase
MSPSVVQWRGRAEVAERTLAFRFSKPAAFAFKPGQAIDVVLPDADAGPDGLRHTFSLVSAPFEDELVIATRMRDTPFKRALASLGAESRIGIEGPFGSLTLHNDRTRAAVFIAGGIGITPFLSMVRQAAHDDRPQRLLLLYANRRPEDAAYLDELTDMQQRYPRFRLIATMTGMAASTRAWTGERRRIDVDFVAGAIPQGTRPVFYVAGPPPMVEGLRTTLERAGVDDDDIRSEDFFGY